MFKYEGKSHLINDCVKIANDLVLDENFRGRIRECEFDMATCDGVVIAKDIKESAEHTRVSLGFPMYPASEKMEKTRYNVDYIPVHPIVVKTYRSKNPWSSALGYFSPSQPDHIFLNNRKLNRSKGSIVATLIHEMIHFCDYLNEVESYGHGDNSPSGKENTAPFYIDNIAESIVDDKQPSFKNVENGNIKTYVPLYIKIINMFKGFFK